MTQSFPIREQVAAVSGVSAQKKVTATPTFSLRAGPGHWARALHRAASSEGLPKKHRVFFVLSGVQNPVHIGFFDTLKSKCGKDSAGVALVEYVRVAGVTFPDLEDRTTIFYVRLAKGALVLNSYSKIGFDARADIEAVATVGASVH